MITFRHRVKCAALALASAAVVAAFVPHSLAQDAKKDAASKDDAKNEIVDSLGRTIKAKNADDLEKLFGDSSRFGGSVSQMSYSADGRFAAYLYEPYPERRHGSDIYIYDTKTGMSRRITTASRMAEFQASAREVVEDREKKAKAAKLPRYAELTAKKVKDKKDDKGKEKDDAESGADLETLVGSYAGSISDASAVLEDDTAATLTIKGDSDAVTGDFDAGLVRLPIRDFKIDEGDLTATIGEEGDGLEGKLEGTVTKDQAISGKITLTTPKLTMNFAVTRDAEKVEKKEDDKWAQGILKVEGQELEVGDLVTDKDADDRRAPRYGGIQNIEWSPEGTEMLVLSGGDIYRLSLDASKWDEVDENDMPYRGELERLTRTRERESRVAYLPDASGYTYLREGALLHVSFGDHKILQLDPPLEDNEQMSGYAISPDMKRLVFLASKSDPNAAQRMRQVTIVSYRDRFAQAREVRRMVADDDMPSGQASVYLYDLTGHEREEGTLKRVFTRSVTGPRDVMMVPEWSPDSTKVAFAAFDQSTSEVSILEAGFDEEEVVVPTTKPGESDAEAMERKTADAQEKQNDDTDGESDDEKDVDIGDDETATTKPAPLDEVADPEFTIVDARTVYKFLHNGGPNTPRMIQPRYLPDSRHLVFIAELSGFRHLHILDPVYEQLQQITFGKREIYPFDQSDDHSRLYVTATVEGDPAQEWAYEVDLLDRSMRRLCKEDGVVSNAAVSDDGTNMLAIKEDFGGPRELYAYDCADETIEVTQLSDFHPKLAHEMTAVKPEYFNFENRHGHTIYGHMFKPEDWTPEDKRPLLIYVYGGPLGDSNQISRGSYSSPSYFFARYMTEKHGWVTATVDPRGASGLGAVFEKANFEKVGEPQTEDLVDAADWLVENAGVDEDRRALHGWSFGGFQTQMTMYTEPDAFAAGIAGAGPTEWQNYNAWYTTGTVGPKSDFKEDVEQHSIVPLAKNLEGRLLLVHGVEDSNVLYQDTINVYRQLLQAGKEHLVDLFIDPTGGHGLGGDVKTLGRYRKYEDFLLTHIGKGEPAKAAEPEAEAESDEEEVDKPAAKPPTTKPATRPTTRPTTRSAA